VDGTGHVHGVAVGLGEVGDDLGVRQVRPRHPGAP
jgi:hypothetical protein